MYVCNIFFLQANAERLFDNYKMAVPWCSYVEELKIYTKLNCMYSPEADGVSLAKT